MEVERFGSLEEAKRAVERQFVARPEVIAKSLRLVTRDAGPRRAVPEIEPLPLAA